jgi:heme exporter protein D
LKEKPSRFSLGAGLFYVWSACFCPLLIYQKLIYQKLIYQKLIYQKQVSSA